MHTDQGIQVIFYQEKNWKIKNYTKTYGNIKNIAIGQEMITHLVVYMVNLISKKIIK